MSQQPSAIPWRHCGQVCLRVPSSAFQTIGGLLRSAPRDIKLAEKTLKNILQRSQRPKGLTLAYVDRVEDRHDHLVDPFIEVDTFQDHAHLESLGQLPSGQSLDWGPRSGQIAYFVSKTSVLTDLDGH